MSDANSSVEYRPIEGFPKYRTGTDGSLWSQWNCGTHAVDGKWRKLDRKPNCDGYIPATLYEGATRRSTYVHVLVPEAFRGPCPKRHEARHLDGNPSNNHLDNLLWGTRKENCADTRRHGRATIGDNHPQAMLTEEAVVQMRRRVRSGEAITSVARDFCVSPQIVQQAVTGRSWKAVTEPCAPKRLARMFTDEQVREIRKRRAAGEQAASIAASFNCTRNLIYSAATGKSYRKCS